MLENTPTHIRGNVLAITGIMLLGVMLPTIFVINGLIAAFPGNIQMVLLSVGIPACLAVIFGTSLKLKETVQVDITNTEG